MRIGTGIVGVVGALLFAAPGSARDVVLPSLGEAEVVSGGHEGLEGPVAADHSILFSDVSAGRILRWDASSGEAATLDPASGGANGLATGPGDRLFRCEGGGRRVTASTLRTGGGPAELDGPPEVLADAFEGEAFNAPNDAIVVGDFLLFTDPRYGDRDSMEMAVEGVYAVPLGGGNDAVVRLLGDLVRPNGITATADGSTVYVADEGARKVMAYRFEPGGGDKPPALVDGRVFADVAEHGNPDGMAVDLAGRVYVALFLTGKLLVLSPDGEPLSLSDAGERTSNVCLDADQAHAYVTAGGDLLRFRLGVDRPADEAPAPR